MIDMGIQRFVLPPDYASKFKRIKYRSSSVYELFSVLMLATPWSRSGPKPAGEECFPNVKEAEISYPGFNRNLKGMARARLGSKGVDELVFETKDIVFIDCEGNRMTLAEILLGFRGI